MSHSWRIWTSWFLCREKAPTWRCHYKHLQYVTSRLRAPPLRHVTYDTRYTHESVRDSMYTIFVLHAIYMKSKLMLYSTQYIWNCTGRFMTARCTSRPKALGSGVEARIRFSWVGSWLFLGIHCTEWKKETHRGSGREVGGWGRVPFSRNLMSPTPRRKWYLTTGRRAH